MSETQVRTCSCHCGKVRFEAKLPVPLKASRCNCSICAKKSVAMVYVPIEDLTVTAGEDVLSCYRFNTMVAKHWFCSNCGIHCFHQARSDPDKYGVNAATIDGVRVYEDFEHTSVFDGVRHALDNDGVRRMAGKLHFESTPDTPWPPDGF